MLEDASRSRGVSQFGGRKSTDRLGPRERKACEVRRTAHTGCNEAARPKPLSRWCRYRQAKGARSEARRSGDICTADRGDMSARADMAAASVWSRDDARWPAIEHERTSAMARSPGVAGGRESAVEIEGGADERQVRERLGEVAEVLRLGTELLAVQAQVTGVAEHLLEEEPRLL